MDQQVTTELTVSTQVAVGSRMKRINASGEEDNVGAAPNDGLQLEAASLVVTPATAALNAGETQQLKCVMTDQKGNDTDVTDFVQWSSSDDAVATVSPEGLITSVTGAAATITATLNGQTDTCAVS